MHLEVLSRLSMLLMDDEFRTNLLDAAVTACSTGIAHTYMAAESLENKAKEMGISIKVETNGSGGAKNVLSRRTADRSNKRKSGGVS